MRSFSLLPRARVRLSLLVVAFCSLLLPQSSALSTDFVLTRNLSLSGQWTPSLSHDGCDRLYFLPGLSDAVPAIHGFDLLSGLPLPPISFLDDAPLFNLPPTLTAEIVKADQSGSLHVFVTGDDGLSGLIALDPFTGRWQRWLAGDEVRQLHSFDVSADGSRYLLSQADTHVTVVNAFDGARLLTLPHLGGVPVSFNKLTNNVLVGNGAWGTPDVAIYEYLPSGDLHRARVPAAPQRALPALSGAVGTFQACDDGSVALVDGSGVIGIMTAGDELVLSDAALANFFTNALAVDAQCSITAFYVESDDSGRALYSGLLTLTPGGAAASPIKTPLAEAPSASITPGDSSEEAGARMSAVWFAAVLVAAVALVVLLVLGFGYRRLPKSGGVQEESAEEETPYVTLNAPQVVVG